MYASLSMFKTAPGKRDDVTKTADLCYAMVKDMKRFKDVVYFADYEQNHFGMLYVWETKEDLDAGYNTLMSKLQDSMNSLAVEPPVRHVFEVYEPK